MECCRELHRMGCSAGLWEDMSVELRSHRPVAAFAAALRANRGLMRRLELRVSWLGCAAHQQQLAEATAACSPTLEALR